MLTHPLAAYLADCRDRRGTGAVTPETSLYGPFETLLNAAAEKLKPRVRCFMNLKNRGGNMPDGGLFTPNQIDKTSDEPIEQKPSRGVIECKKPKDDLLALADSPQVSRYWDQYEQVLVTNYREFLLLGKDENGKRKRFEHFKLTDTEKEFWSADAAALTKDRGDAFLDFLKRCLLRPAPVAAPKDVAWFLASYAREAKSRMERAGDVPALANVQRALEQALGLTFDTAKEEEGRRFFRSTLVQTLFYGVFSAWVLWHRAGPKKGDRFDWERAAKYLKVPVLRKLFYELAEPGKLEEWKLDEVLGWAGDVLNRVDRAAFFGKFQDTEAVQYFYEPFLEQFDPVLRKQLGVWYTPPEIVKYMVGRVDRVLKEELDRPDGLLDKSVFVLDPCCGTGAYLVEVLRHINDEMIERGEDAMRGPKLIEAATTRIFGFELLPAPFVVAHLQIGLFFQQLGVNVPDTQRPGIYLTNALTGWDPKQTAQKNLFEEFDKERALADDVKRKKPILVVIGNPPYNGFAGIAIAEERALSDNYRAKKDDPKDLKPQGQGLNDLYVRFFRMAERCIVDGQKSEGIVCFISNYSWLDGLSFPLMRQRYLKEFDDIWIDNLNGDKYRTGKLTPEGKPDPSAFSTERNREGIQVGTAITTLCRKVDHEHPARVHYRDYWGITKRKELSSFGQKWKSTKYSTVKPQIDLCLAFRPMSTTKGYTKWPLLPDIFPTYFNGVQSSRDDVVVDIDQSVLIKRMEMYFDSKVTHEQMRKIAERSLTDTKRFNAIKTREKLQAKGFIEKNVVPFAFRPFDNRWLYWESETKLLDEKRPEYISHIFDRNLWLSAVQQNRKDYDSPVVQSVIGCRHLIERGANVFPMLLAEQTNGHTLFGEVTGRECHKIGDYCANITDIAFEYMAERGGIKSAPSLFYNAIAITHAPRFAIENSDALRQDWPRIPLPNSPKLLNSSSKFGERITDLLNPDKGVSSVTSGKLLSQFKAVASPSRIGGGRFDIATEFEVTAHWGIKGKNSACMPSTGKAIERAYTADERTALGDGIAQLGDTTFDVYLNEKAYWSCVPAKVWRYTLGGYQVLKKWLSYRESALLGRSLRLDEVEYVQQVARRIAALLLMGPELDANYEAVKADLYPWPGRGA